MAASTIIARRVGGAGDAAAGAGVEDINRRNYNESVPLSRLGKQSALSIAAATESDLAEVAELAGVIGRRHYPGIITPEQIDYMLALGYSHAALSRFIEEAGAGLDLARFGDRLAGFSAYYRTDGGRELKLDKLYGLQELQG